MKNLLENEGLSTSEIGKLMSEIFQNFSICKVHKKLGYERTADFYYSAVPDIHSW